MSCSIQATPLAKGQSRIIKVSKMGNKNDENHADSFVSVETKDVGTS